MKVSVGIIAACAKTDEKGLYIDTIGAGRMITVGSMDLERTLNSESTNVRNTENDLIV